MSTRVKWPRVLVGLLAGAAMTVAPYLYYWRLEWHPLQTTALPYFCLLLCPVVAGGFVTTMLASTRPRWWTGAVLGFVLGAIAAGFYFRRGGDVPQEWWLQTLLGLCFAALSALAGAVGGLLGHVVSRPLVRGSSSGAPARPKPWQVGVAVAFVAVVVFGALAAFASA